MIKQVFVTEIGNMIEHDRWYFRYHSKEAMRWYGPWMRRYETYRAYDAPPETDDAFIRQGRVTEIWYNDVQDFDDAGSLRKPYTFPSPIPWTVEGDRTHMATSLVPANPTEDFLGKEPTPEAVPILRFYSLFSYPEGVPMEEGEKWYLEVHAQEAKEQPGLLRYISHKAILEDSPMPWAAHRLTECWYESLDAWRAAVVDSPIAYTPPPWHKEGPYVNAVSAFIPCKPDVDFLKDNPLIP